MVYWRLLFLIVILLPFQKFG